MKTITKTIILFTFFTLTLGTDKLTACTDFRIIAKDKTVINARTMEFPSDLKSRIWVIPRGVNTTSINDKGIKGLSWTNKYAFMALDAYGMDSTYIDGFNEAGLSAGGLMFTEAVYQKAEPGKFVTYADIISWLLGNFKNVEEVKKELPKIKIADTYIKKVRGSLGLHFAIHDATGKSIVVEFINGEQNIHDNIIGVTTNRPNFAWHMQNLSNYINLDHKDKNPRTINGYKIQPTGVGSGLLGLPGDWTPPSRFVRIAFAVDASVQSKSANDAINLAEHIMNTVDIPIGAIKEKYDMVITLYGNAQWSIIKDLTNKTMYFRTYDNMTLRKIDLNKFKLSSGSPKKYIDASTPSPKFIDVTQQFRL